MYIITLVTKILHFLKLKYKESNLQDSMQQCNYTTDGIFNLHMGCLSVHRESGGGGHSLPPDTKDSILFSCHPWN